MSKLSRAIRDALSGAQTTIAAKRQEVADLKAALAKVHEAPLLMEDAEMRLEAWINHKLGGDDTVYLGGLFSNGPYSSAPELPEDPVRAMAALVGRDIIRDRLRAQLRAQKPKADPLPAARAAMTRDAEKRIRTAEYELAELLEEALKAGITVTVPHEELSIEVLLGVPREAEPVK